MERVIRTLTVPVAGPIFERAALSLFLVLTTFLGAYVAVPLPFTPVPLTLQTFFVLLSGVLLGRGWSLGTQCAYLGLGGAGWAAFAGAAAGSAHLFGPTAGYLWAFPLAAVLTGTLWRRSEKAAPRLFALAAADALILGAGALWLGVLLGLSPWKAFLMGVAPFLPGEALKVTMVLAVGTFRRKG
ncbi:MAG: biotin transporter BioY [Acidobacteriota bacterium]